MTPPQKRARTSSPPPVTSPTTPTALPTLSEIACLPLDASHNLILALLTRDPTAGSVIATHINAHTHAQGESAPLEFDGLVYTYGISSSLRLKSERPASRTRLARDLDQKITKAVEEMLSGCQSSDFYETRLSAFKSMQQIANMILNCEDIELRFAVSGGVLSLDDGMTEVWEMLDYEERDQLLEDEDNFYKQVKYLHKEFASMTDGHADTFLELARSLSEDGELTDDEEYSDDE